MPQSTSSDTPADPNNTHSNVSKRFRSTRCDPARATQHRFLTSRAPDTILTFVGRGLGGWFGMRTRNWMAVRPRARVQLNSFAPSPLPRPHARLFVTRTGKNRQTRLSHDPAKRPNLHRNFSFSLWHNCCTSMASMSKGSHGFTATEITIALALILIIVGGIAYPKYRKGRIAAREAEVIGDIRAVASAEQMFASANCGWFDDLPNLCRDGEECNGISIPGYSASAPEFLSGELGRRSPYVKSSYVRSFTEGRLPEQVGRTLPDPGRCSPTSVLEYCYFSSPVTAGLTMLEFGGRSFANDELGCLHVLRKGEPTECPLTHESSPLE